MKNGESQMSLKDSKGQTHPISKFSDLINLGKGSLFINNNIAGHWDGDVLWNPEKRIVLFNPKNKFVIS